jgi:TPR repeat protein
MFSHGQGVKQSKKSAVRWYRKAAENGNAEAMYNLGANLYYGQFLDG